MVGIGITQGGQGDYHEDDADIGNAERMQAEDGLCTAETGDETCQQEEKGQEPEGGRGIGNFLHNMDKGDERRYANGSKSGK